eukprot:365099-Chlamydomonas_euryale.AAC.2
MGLLGSNDSRRVDQKVRIGGGVTGGAPCKAIDTHSWAGGREGARERKGCESVNAYTGDSSAASSSGLLVPWNMRRALTTMHSAPTRCRRGPLRLYPRNMKGI